MASGLVRCALSEVVHDEKFQLNTPRITLLQCVGRDILDKITHEDNVARFDSFSTNLTAALRSNFDCAKRCRSFSTKKTKIWSAFHQVRQVKLPSIWKEFLESIHVDVEREDPLLQQSVNQKLFDMLLSEHLEPPSSSQSRPVSEDEPMSKDELNALQYAGGYVPHSLLKKYEKQAGLKYDQFVTCLGNMAVHSSHDELLEYTKEWIGRVNRGGLFPLNNTTFLLFVGIEKQVKRLLSAHVVKGPSSKEQFKVEIIDKIVNDDDVQWQWTLLSQDIDSEDDSNELLKAVITLWVTIRGFSLCALWMENYKQEVKKGTKKAVGLRKGLSN